MSTDPDANPLSLASIHDRTHGTEAAHARQDAYRECPRPGVLFTADGCFCPYCLRAAEDNGCTCDGPAVIVVACVTWRVC